MLRRFGSVALLCLVAEAATGQADLLTLEIGDPERRHRLEITRDAIVDTLSGDVLSVQSLTDRIGSRRIVLIGEQHTDAAHHLVQLRVLEALRDAGRPLLIGAEMFPVDLQPILDAWTRGEVGETAFLARSDWYRVWGYDWRYYREVFLFARAHAIPIVGLRGVELEDGEPASAADLGSEDHQKLLRAFFESDSPVHGGLTPAQFADLFAAQSQRDATMAGNLRSALRSYPDRTAVVLAGTGHVVYELGIVRQLPAAERASAATVMPVPVPMDTDVALVTAAIGDFAWGIPASAFPAYPELGIMTTATAAGLHVIYVEADSAAALAGIEAGDLLTRYANHALAQRSDLRRALASARWGDEVAIELRRGDDAHEIPVRLRRRGDD